jgi:hypothetical protein
MAQTSCVAAAAPTVVGAAADRALVIEWIFRIAVAMEFVGHGAFGLLTKAAWVPYFAVVGIPEAWAWRLMPLVGAMDVAAGVLALVVPVRAVLLHMSLWGLMTATLRPLSGEGVWELLERGYNYGVPLAFLLVAGAPRTFREWFVRVDLRTSAGGREAARLVLRGAIALSLVGHAGVALLTHTRWAVHLEALGLGPASARGALAAAAWLELALGLAILVAPVTGLLVAAGLWKIATEALRIPAGEPIWEFVERGGAYAAPVLLILLRPESGRPASQPPGLVGGADVARGIEQVRGGDGVAQGAGLLGRRVGRPCDQHAQEQAAVPAREDGRSAVPAAGGPVRLHLDEQLVADVAADAAVANHQLLAAHGVDVGGDHAPRRVDEELGHEQRLVGVSREAVDGGDAQRGSDGLLVHDARELRIEAEAGDVAEAAARADRGGDGAPRPVEEGDAGRRERVVDVVARTQHVLAAHDVGPGVAGAPEPAREDAAHGGGRSVGAHAHAARELRARAGVLARVLDVGGQRTQPPLPAHGPVGVQALRHLAGRVARPPRPLALDEELHAGRPLDDASLAGIRPAEAVADADHVRKGEGELGGPGRGGFADEGDPVTQREPPEVRLGRLRAGRLVSGADRLHQPRPPYPARPLSPRHSAP